jgi:putative pyruvate formate lyase activating enzyme
MPALTSPSYLALYRSGQLTQRVEQSLALLEHCTLCPRLCGVNRLRGEKGVCDMGAEAVVASHTLHHWEEPPISGSRGSGTIFFSGCTGRCMFCQNYPISQMNRGNLTEAAGLAKMMVRLQRRGAHNINFVTPTHFVPQIIAALPLAIGQGFSLPLVYNSSGYETVETLRLLDGVIDIYLPDAKYADEAVARQLSGFRDYVVYNRAALPEIFRQVGAGLLLDDEGLAVRGLIVRHMVLPGGLAGTAEVLSWLAANLSPEIHVSLMAQYFPAYQAVGHPLLGRKVTPAEYAAAVSALEQAGLDNGWVQELDDEE